MGSTKTKSAGTTGNEEVFDDDPESPKEYGGVLQMEELPVIAVGDNNIVGGLGIDFHLVNADEFCDEDEENNSQAHEYSSENENVGGESNVDRNLDDQKSSTPILLERESNNENVSLYAPDLHRNRNKQLIVETDGSDTN